MEERRGKYWLSLSSKGKILLGVGFMFSMSLSEEENSESLYL